jgi:uncharacterized repeat protein (TIGR01451 family)
MQELVILLVSTSVLALLVTLVTCALGLRRRAIRGGLGWAEALSQWWAWLRTDLSAWSSAASSGSGVLSPRHPRTSRVWRAWLVLVWVAAVFLVPYQAQPVSAKHTVGYSEYYILGAEEDILAALIEVNPRQTGPFRTQGPIRSRVSIVAVADGTNVYLDEWENGYGFDPSDPYNTADAKWDAAPGGLGEEGPALNEGQVLTLSETDTFVPGSEGVDGGDRLYVTGAPVSLVRTVWPEVPGPYLAGSWEFYPLLAWQDSYVVPVGEDLDFAPDSTFPFEYTFLFIEAAEDGTRVVVTDPTGVVLTDIVLSQGENIYLPDINAGTTVSATGPIQAGLITSVNEVYDSRYYTLTPQEFLCDEYFLPVPSMQFPALEIGGRDIDTAAYIYAFQDNTVVNIETGAGTQTITMDAGEVYRYVMPRIPRGTIEGPYGARVTTDDPGQRIWILVAGDDDAPDLDWGYQAMCSSLLGREHYLPFAPANPAYVTPMDEDTTFFVDWNNDGVTDETFTLNRFDTRMLFDPDQDATGAHIYADGPFAIAWGQDNTERTPGEPTIDYDYGYTILPLEPPQWLDPVLSIEKTVDPPSLPAEGGAVQFTLLVSTGDYPVYNVDISDVLPVGWEYVDDSTSIAPSYGTGGSGPSYDPSISGYLLTWDLAGLGLNDTMPANSTIALTYQAQTIPGVYSAGLHDNLAQAYGTSTVDEDDPNAAVFRPEDHAFVFIPNEPYLNLVKTSSVEGVVGVGDGITYTICFSNSGLIAATGVVITDLIPANTRYVTDSVTGPAPPIAPPPPLPAIEYRTDTGDWVSPEPSTVTGLRWNIGQLVTGTTHCVSFQVQVTTQAQGINNVATIDSNETDPLDDPAYNPFSEGPGPEPPEPGPRGPGPSPPTPIPPTPVPPTPTVEVLPVERLPETGGFPGWFPVVLGVPIIIGAAGLLNLARLELRGRRGDGKGD